MNKKPKLFRIWRPAYRPFMHGGNVRAPICVRMPADAIHKEKGFSVGVVRHAGKTLVFCTESGGVVGESLSRVVREIKMAKPSVVRKQIAEAKVKGRTATEVPVEKFFG